MLSAVADLSLHRPRRVVVASLAVFVVAAVVGGPVAGMLKARNSFQDPSSQSARAQRLIEAATGAEPHAGVLALVSAPPSSAAVAAAARTLRADPAVLSVATPAGTHDPALVSRDGQMSVVAATLRSGPAPNDVAKRIEASFSARRDVLLGGSDVSGEQVNEQAGHDLGFAELLAFPLLAILAFMIFGGIAALLPLAVGASSVMGTFLVLRAVNALLPLSSFALNVVIGLGLGLAIDYSLYLLSRFREELLQSADVSEALRATLRTAGRTVAFSGATVAAAMACLAIFPQRFLISMGIGGAVVALVAAGSALLILPALFVLLGARLGRERQPAAGGRWYRLAHAVMRRPALVALGTTAVLLALAAPSLHASWSGIDASVLPKSKSARVVSDILASDFRAQDLNTVTIAVDAPPSASGAVTAYERRLLALPGVAEAGRTEYLGRGLWSLTLSADGEPISKASQQLIDRIRATPSPAPVAVGGPAAEFLDQRAAIASTLPLALIALAITTLLILWLMTGSVVLPLKSLVMNALTTAAATGLLVFIFQDGRLEGLLGYTGQGGIEQTDFLVLAAITFALATDYGVMLLTRIKEERDAGHSDREAIARGLERTGRIVTAAAILLAVAIGAFATSKVVFIKEVGVGAAAAVLIDAFLVRALLVPSLMALLGARNWWSPKPLRRLHQRLGFAEPPARRQAGEQPARARTPAAANRAGKP